MIKNNRNYFLEDLQQESKVPLEHISIIMINEVQSGASRQEYQNKARNTTTKTTNYVAKKMTTSYKIS